MPKKKILTENPYEELWSYLSYFENYYNCYNYLKQNHNISDVKIRKQRASMLQYYVRQAHEYYTSSLKVSLLTQPTLLYYGALCLSRALFLGKNGYPDDSTGHGLNEADNRKLKNIKDFKIKTNKRGTFSQFYRSIHSSYNNSFEEILMAEWTLKELLSLIPEIKDIYEDIYNQKSLVIRVDRFFDEDDEYIKITDEFFSKMKNDEVNNFLNNIKNLYDFYLPPKRLTDSSILFHKRTNVNGDITCKNLMGEEYLISEIKKNKIIDIPGLGAVHLIISINLPDIAAHIMLLYLLSMLSRYHIKSWGEGSLGLESGDFYIIKNFLRLTTRKFPNLVLNQLLSKEYIFTSELYKPKDLRIDKYKAQISEMVKDILEKEKKDKRTEKLMMGLKHDLWG